jgi:hypothetical protein
MSKAKFVLQVAGCAYQLLCFGDTEYPSRPKHPCTLHAD